MRFHYLKGIMGTVSSRRSRIGLQEKLILILSEPSPSGLPREC